MEAPSARRGRWSHTEGEGEGEGPQPTVSRDQNRSQQAEPRVSP